jgi:hypothetical protein
MLKPGNSFHIPKGTKHAFASGPAGARGIVVASLSGFSHLIQTVATPAEPNSLPLSLPPTLKPLAAR